MKIIEVKSNYDKKRYINFIYYVYKNDGNYSDLNIFFVKNFLYQKDSYSKRSNIIPIIIEDNGIKLVCMFISNKDCNYLKLCFLEFLPNARKYIEAIIDYGKELLNTLSLDKIVIGLNGHVSYGLGILVHNYNTNFEFNSNYNPNYYVEELDELIKIKKKAFSFKYTYDKSMSMINKEMIKNIKSTFSIRCLDKKHFKRDMIIFGEICDKALKQTPYYSYKSSYEMYELLKNIRMLIKNEDILFVLKDGKEVGFIFTHPDYAQLMDKPKINYIKLFFKNIFMRANTLIYDVIGIIPELQQSGLAMYLIYESMERKKKNYSNGVSSFILEDNLLSMTLCKKLAVDINKEYRLYEIEKEKL